jgi:hypothetical protein
MVRISLILQIFNVAASTAQAAYSGRNGKMILNCDQAKI